MLPREAIAVGEADAGWAALGHEPEAVVRPGSADEVASVMAWASAEGVGVVPAGSGRRLRPRTVDGPFVVLTTERLFGIEIYEPADLTLTAGAGTTVRDIDERLRPNRQWLPFDPPDVLDRTLGGLVAMGDSGPLWTGYGALRNHVLGMTVVTGDARILRLGGRVVKNVAGFDLLKPMVGSRGRLAVITSVCLRAFPLPTVDRALVLRAPRAAELVPAALAVGTAPVLPASSVLHVDYPPGGAGAGGSSGATLTVRLHGVEATVEADRATLEARVGRAFEVGDAVDAGTRSGVADATGGATATGGGTTATGNAEGATLVASFLPSRLADAVAAIERSGARSTVVDTYAASARVDFTETDAGRLDALRSAIEGIGGALRVERAGAGAGDGAAALAGQHSPSGLESRLLDVFDPKGVLWRRAR
jgi:FAD/FMN-containing dehydrogenase